MINTGGNVEADLKAFDLRNGGIDPYYAQSYLVINSAPQPPSPEDSTPTIADQRAQIRGQSLKEYIRNIRGGAQLVGAATGVAILAAAVWSAVENGASQPSYSDLQRNVYEELRERQPYPQVDQNQQGATSIPNFSGVDRLPAVNQ